MQRETPISPDTADEEDGDRSLADWLSPWGTSSVCLASASLLQSSLLGFRSLTVIIGFIGLAVVYLGMRATKDFRPTKDVIWLSLGGVSNMAIVAVALLTPGVLNEWWALDAATSLPREQRSGVAVPRDAVMDTGRPVAEEDWVDAATEAIRKEYLAVRVESVKVATPKGSGGAQVLVHLRLMNAGSGEPISVQGFNAAPPTLKAESGSDCPFVEFKVRKQARGAPAFEPASGQPLELSLERPQDFLLVFTSGSPSASSYLLEIPASAWGRKGICKLRIPASFDSSLSDKPK